MEGMPSLSMAKAAQIHAHTLRLLHRYSREIREPLNAPVISKPVAREALGCGSLDGDPAKSIKGNMIGSLPWPPRTRTAGRGLLSEEQGWIALMPNAMLVFAVLVTVFGAASMKTNASITARLAAHCASALMQKSTRSFSRASGHEAACISAGRKGGAGSPSPACLTEADGEGLLALFVALLHMNANSGFRGQDAFAIALIRPALCLNQP
jgi:hypothetical protein